MTDTSVPESLQETQKEEELEFFFFLKKLQPPEAPTRTGTASSKLMITKRDCSSYLQKMVKEQCEDKTLVRAQPDSFDSFMLTSPMFDAESLSLCRHEEAYKTCFKWNP